MSPTITIYLLNTLRQRETLFSKASSTCKYLHWFKKNILGFIHVQRGSYGGKCSCCDLAVLVDLGCPKLPLQKIDNTSLEDTTKK